MSPRRSSHRPSLAAPAPCASGREVWGPNVVSRWPMEGSSGPTSPGICTEKPRCCLGAGSSRAVGVSDFSGALTEAEKSQEGKKKIIKIIIKNPFRLLFFLFPPPPSWQSNKKFITEHGTNSNSFGQAVFFTVNFKDFCCRCPDQGFSCIFVRNNTVPGGGSFLWEKEEPEIFHSCVNLKHFLLSL